MASQNVDDCYFYYYSSCTKGEECPYRHCQQALGTETVCSLWREGRCFRSNCKFRHMESQINRSAIPCYWENQPGGCRKPHCVFLHRKLKNGVPVDPRMILPVLNGKSSSDSNDRSSPVVSQSPSSPGLNKDLISDPASVPVPRLVLSFDEAEESDTESVSSTPVKGPSDDTKVVQNDFAKKSLASKLSATAKEKDFGIKTLEQIRMEKIHKESNHYYSDEATDKVSVSRNPTLLNDSIFCHSGYDAPSLESPHIECYPPKSDFISLPASPSLDKSSPTSNAETSRPSVDVENDLRSRLFKRINQKAVAEKGASLKQQPNKKTNEESPKDLNFKIKTLDEIRKERENKRGPPTEEVNSSSEDNKAGPSNEEPKPAKKPKITRNSQDLYVVAEVVKHPLREQKTMPSYSFAQEKRKAGSLVSGRQRKLIKVDSGQAAPVNGSVPEGGDKEKKILNNLGSFLRQPKTQVSPPSDNTSSIQQPLFNDDNNNDYIIQSSSTDNLSQDSNKPISVLPSTLSPAKSSLLSSNDQDDVFPPPNDHSVSENICDTQNKDSVYDMTTDNVDIKTENRIRNLSTVSDMPMPSNIPSDSVCDMPTTGNDLCVPAKDDSVPTTEDNVRETSAIEEESTSSEDGKDNVTLDRSVSVDEFDSFLNETDMNSEDAAGSEDGDDILAEVEEFLDS